MTRSIINIKEKLSSSDVEIYYFAPANRWNWIKLLFFSKLKIRWKRHFIKVTALDFEKTDKYLKIEKVQRI